MAALAHWLLGPACSHPGRPLIYCESRSLSLRWFRDFFVQMLDQTQFTLWAHVLLSFFFFFNSLDIFFTATPSLQSIYLWTVLFYKYFPNTDKVKFLYRSAPTSLPNQWVFGVLLKGSRENKDILTSQGMMGTWKFKGFKGLFAPKGLIIPIY